MLLQITDRSLQQPRVFQEPTEPTARDAGGQEAGTAQPENRHPTGTFAHTPARNNRLVYTGTAQRYQGGDEGPGHQ